MKKLLRRLFNAESLFGFLIAAFPQIWKYVKVASDMEFLLGTIEKIGDFLATGTGALVPVSIGLSMVAHSMYRDRDSETAPSVPKEIVPASESSEATEIEESHAKPQKSTIC